MSYKPTHRELQNGNIVDAKTFDQAYDHLKGELNGNLNQQNLPAGSVAPADLSQGSLYSFHYAYCKVNEEEVIDGVQSSGSPFSDTPGISYGEYGGGWAKTKLDLEFEAIEGSMFLEFSCWSHINHQIGGGEFAGGGGIPKAGTWIAFQILYNGNVVAEIDRQYRTFNTHRMACVIPCATEKATVSVRWRITGRREDTTTYPLSNAPMAYWSGGTIFAMNRYR
jgi:hypothetical protein